MIGLALTWSVLMAPPTPPLTEAQKTREYEMAKVEEVLTPAQLEARDIIPGWRPIPPLSDIQRAAIEIVPGEPNPDLIQAWRHIGGQGLAPEELTSLGAPSPSPAGFADRTGAEGGWWYAELDGQGRATGVWFAVCADRGGVRAHVLVGRRAAGADVVDRAARAVDAAGGALRGLKRALSGDAQPSPEAQAERVHAQHIRSGQSPTHALSRAMEAYAAAVHAHEVLTPAQLARRDIIPGWRPIPAPADSERGGGGVLRPLEGYGLTRAELDMLGAPSPSPLLFHGGSGIRVGYWYEQVDAEGLLAGVRIVLFKSPVFDRAEALMMTEGGAFDEMASDRDEDAAIEAIRGLKSALSGEPPPPLDEWYAGARERHKRMIEEVRRRRAEERR